MAFNLRSGNKSSFKNIGSSPAKETSSMSASTKKKKWYVDNYEENKDKPGFQDSMNKVFGGETTMDGMISTTTKKTPAKQKVDPDAPGTPGQPGYEPPVKRSDLDEKGKAIWDAHRAKQKVEKGQGKLIKGQGELKKQTNSWKGTEGQDQDKIFNSKGEHVGDWVDGKKVMRKQPKTKK